MSKSLTHISSPEKIFLREKIINGARNYEKYLKDKTFLIISDNLEVYSITFPIMKYKHLTGLYSSLDSEDFYKQCKKGTISISQIDDFQKYNLKTLRKKAKKVENIQRVIYSDTTNSLFLKNLHTNTAIFPIGIVNDNLNVCLGFGDLLQVATLRTSNNSKNADELRKILCIFEKNSNEANFTKIIYISNIKDVFEKKKELFAFLSPEIINKISYVLNKIEITD